MAQLRFNIGVPRSGSAAEAAESTPRDVRALKPRAGSAAQQSEQERREFERYGVTRPPTAPVRMRAATGRVVTMEEMIAASGSPSPGVSTAASVPANPRTTPDGFRQAGSSSVVASTHRESTFPVEQTLSGNAADAGGSASSAVSTASRTSLSSAPLQTAAAKVKSLFRSIFS